MGQRIRVAIAGAAGRMGRASVRTIAKQDDMSIVAALGRANQVGRDAGEVAGGAPINVKITESLDEALASGVDVLVDFAPGAAAVAHARAAIASGVSPVIGGTGMSSQEINELTGLSEARRVGAVVAPNFAVGAVLMMEFSRQAARYFPHAEIIELHHDRKRDAPSGTAVKTASLIAAGRVGTPPSPVAEEETIAGARGGRAEGVRVHSVRLPGLVAHQEVIFGGSGQTLTIRHDSITEESFMPGLLLAVRKVRSLPGLVYGLEKLLEL
ncbi:MAG TPA: 4-hydroxy-tetrahydrodipicolinate reductase [bacterium]|nr:4-hydroxy-tetrahydrodipicolinate reductase [bacterium]